MRRNLPSLFALLLVLSTTSVPVMAHHAFAGQFDVNKPVILKGTVTKLEWLNPHIYFYIDVKDTSGNVTSWTIEGGSPNGLMRYGWTKNSLKPGMEVSVEGYLAKDGSKIANMTVVTLDGKKVLGRIESPGDAK